jgi:RNA polymerase sigma-70 factor (ECF subfamily)
MKTSIALFPEDSLLDKQEAITPAAFAEMYQLYYLRVYNYVRYRCDDTATAEDLTAQVFERLLARIHTFSPERGPFGAWLFAIARNLVNGHRRSERYRTWLSIDILHRWASEETSPEEATLQNEAEAELLAAIGKLDERDRDLLGLKFAGQLNNRQIAELTGLSESNVGVILHRTIHRLRATLGGHAEEHHSTQQAGELP